MKQLIFLIVLIIVFTISISKAIAQKILNEQETVWVEEAKTELERAITDPTLSESERLQIVERSAKTFKEYGQPSAFPRGDLPLKEMMDNNYEQCKNQIVELSDLSLDLRQKTLEQQMKLINAIQIEVVEEQIEFLIPGKAPFQLSKDAVNTILGINIAEGVNSGKRGDAQSLVASFRQLAEANKLVKNINVTIYDEKQSLRKLDVDRKQVKDLESKLRLRYKYGESSTTVQPGYEGALPRTPGTTVKIPNQPLNTKTPSIASTNIQSKRNVLVGTWKFGYEQTGYFYWTFNNDGTWKFDDKMNDGEKPLTGKYTVFGNILKLTGPKSECADVEGIFPFVIEDGDLNFKRIEDTCLSRKFTLNHVWKK